MITKEVTGSFFAADIVLAFPQCTGVCIFEWRDLMILFFQSSSLLEKLYILNSLPEEAS